MFTRQTWFYHVVHGIGYGQFIIAKQTTLLSTIGRCYRGHNLFKIFVFRDRHHGSELLFVEDVHLVGHRIQYCREEGGV